MTINLNWNHDHGRGKRGEALWNRHLVSKGYETYEATTVQNKSGIDLFATKGDRTVSFDVKNDGSAWKTGNVCLELRSEYPNGRTTDGWATKANCDWFVFVIEQPSMTGYRYHAIKADEVVAKLPMLCEELREIYTERDGNKKTYNLLLPIRDIPEYFDSYNHGELN